MKEYFNNKGRIILSSKFFALCSTLLALSSLLFALCLILPDRASSGPYTISAHGSSSYGVNRTATAGFGYPIGNCAHCHEQHASIGGTEPTPNTLDAAGPDKFCLLANNFDTIATTGAYVQDNNVCFYCHYGLGTYQSPAFSNYSYSITFGGNTDITPATIFDAFNSTSYHNLNDVLNFAKGVSGWPSTFTADSNPCAACHNIHIAQRSCGKPTGSYDPTKSAISKPSDHSNLWGDDDTTERMNVYVGTLTYQAPYWNASTTYFEPYSINTTQDGSNLPDYVTFCTDCHNAANAIASTTLVRNLKTIDWETTGGEIGGDKHGKNGATVDISIDSPFASANFGNYVLSCTDCHEPHGAQSVMLIRREVNGAALDTTIPSYSSTNWQYLCARCHDADTGAKLKNIHHDNTGAPYAGVGGCGSSKCHINGKKTQIPCEKCHFHGGDDSWVSTRDRTPTYRRTF